MKTKILRNIFLSVGVLFASAQLLPAGTITTFDPPGSIFTVAQCHHPDRSDHRILRRRKWRDARLPPDA